MIAIVGASVRAAAMSAARAGFAPVAADLFADEDLRALCPAERVVPYPTGLADWLEGASADAWIYTGALENYPNLVDAVACKKQLLGNPGSVLRHVRCPFLLQEALSAQGLPFPETRDEPTGLSTDGTWLVKSYRGSSGSGIEVYSGQSAMGSRQWGEGGGQLDGSSGQSEGESQVVPDGGVTGRGQPDGNRRYFQRRIEGRPGSAVFVAACGTAQLLGITRQLVGTVSTHAKPFQYAGSVGPWEIGPISFRQVKAIGHALARQFSLAGLFGVDFVIADDAVWTIEVNPRYTSSVEIVERISDLPALAVHEEACAGRHPRFAIRPSQVFHGKAILFARHDLVVPPAFTAWAVSLNDDPSCPAVADIPSPGTPIRRGHPVATAFAAGVTTGGVLKRLEARLATMEAGCIA